MIIQRVEAVIADAHGGSEQLRRLFRMLSATGTELFFPERKLYDIAAVASRAEEASAQLPALVLRSLAALNVTL